MNQSVNANSTRVPGLVRDRGIDRTSITRPTPDSRKRSTNSTIVRVEWPIVKKVFVTSLQAAKARDSTPHR